GVFSRRRARPRPPATDCAMLGRSPTLTAAANLFGQGHDAESGAEGGGSNLDRIVEGEITRRSLLRDPDEVSALVDLAADRGYGRIVGLARKLDLQPLETAGERAAQRERETGRRRTFHV